MPLRSVDGTETLDTTREHGDGLEGGPEGSSCEGARREENAGDGGDAEGVVGRLLDVSLWGLSGGEERRGGTAAGTPFKTTAIKQFTDPRGPSPAETRPRVRAARGGLVKPRTVLGRAAEEGPFLGRPRTSPQKCGTASRCARARGRHPAVALRQTVFFRGEPETLRGRVPPRCRRCLRGCEESGGGKQWRVRAAAVPRAGQPAPGRQELGARGLWEQAWACGRLRANQVGSNHPRRTRSRAGEKAREGRAAWQERDGGSGRWDAAGRRPGWAPWVVAAET